MTQLAMFLIVNYPRELRKGQDATKHRYHREYRDLELHCAWRIDYDTMSAIFNQSQRQVAREVHECRMKLNWERRAKAKVTPKTDPVAALFKTEAGQEANEAWLLHGCKPEVVWKILQKGLNEKLCQLTGAFGAGIYLAEDVEKIDQYTGLDLWGGESRSICRQI